MERAPKSDLYWYTTLVPSYIIKGAGGETILVLASVLMHQKGVDASPINPHQKEAKEMCPQLTAHLGLSRSKGFDEGFRIGKVR